MAQQTGDLRLHPQPTDLFASLSEQATEREMTTAAPLFETTARSFERVASAYSRSEYLACSDDAAMLLEALAGRR